MAHFANIKNGTVVNVLVVPDEHEGDGNAYLNNLGFEGNWMQTSYNTRYGQHFQGKEPLRLNYGGIGMKYDEALDVFFYPKPEGLDSWVFDASTGSWNAPSPYPNDGNIYYWDENLEAWIVQIFDNPDPNYEVE